MDQQNSVESKAVLLLDTFSTERFVALTIALIDTLADKNEKVRDSVAQSIVDTGKKLPKNTVLLCTNYLKKHQKLPDTHRASILRVIERIFTYLQQQNAEVPFDSASFELLTHVAVSELTVPKVMHRRTIGRSLCMFVLP